MPRILVVDDSASTREIAEAMLAGAGYGVCTCGEGKRARQMLEREAFDLVITDIYMPEEDGLAVIRECRLLRPNLPIVAMSGITGRYNMLAVARRMGACQQLLKPFSNADLLTVVGAALGAA